MLRAPATIKTQCFQGLQAFDTGFSFCQHSHFTNFFTTVAKSVVKEVVKVMENRGLLNYEKTAICYTPYSFSTISEFRCSAACKTCAYIVSVVVGDL